MEAVDKYKEMVDEVGHMLYVFANFKDYPFKDLVKEQGWTLENIKKMQVRVQHFGDITKQIKDELIVDGDEAKFMGRLKTTFFELGADPYFAPSYFPVFDEALFELPSKDEPDRNKEMVEALVSVYGEEAGKVMLSLRVIVQWANMIVEKVSKMLDEVCKFVGYTPELQEQAEPQQGEQELKDLLPEQLKSDEIFYIFQKGIDAKLIEKSIDGLCWKDTKQLLAYFAEKISNRFSLTNRVDKDGNKTIDWKTFETIFNVTGLKTAKQNWMRLNTRFEPTGYEKVDALI